MTVYFARAGKDGLVKIGFSTNVGNRITTIQNGCPSTLKIIRNIDAERHTEKWLHRHFKHLHKRGEWFEYSDEMLTVIPPAEKATETGKDKTETHEVFVAVLNKYKPKNGVGKWVKFHAKRADVSTKWVERILYKDSPNKSIKSAHLFAFLNSLILENGHCVAQDFFGPLLGLHVSPPPELVEAKLQACRALAIEILKITDGPDQLQAIIGGQVIPMKGRVG